ncbi:MAG: MerR family transcriptional regulator [Chloroflexota bacterium]|nr:MerR family transcriptional regulator [Chloroflexota bacterium]MDQ5864126.1 MerR family transcriptional regulator [Chloroflexota bacterium]
MTIQELADRAGVTTRTIRYYVEQGVLPPPDRGRPAEYTTEHVKLLDLVRRLKEQYLPLEEIRDMLQRLAPEQVEEFLGGSGSQQEEREPPSSAADYISQVLNRGALRSQLKEQAMPPPPAPSAPPSMPPSRRTAIGAEGASSAPTPTPVAPARPVETVSAATDTQQPVNPYIGEERSWQRVTLVTGVELHYEASLSTTRRNAITKIIEAARAILGPHPEKGTEEQK